MVCMLFFGVIFQFGWIGKCTEHSLEYTFGDCTLYASEPAWATGAIIGLCMIGFWVLIGLIALIKCIAKWLKSNWKEAKEKAEKEFKR